VGALRNEAKQLTGRSGLAEFENELTIQGLKYKGAEIRLKFFICFVYF